MPDQLDPSDRATLAAMLDTAMAATQIRVPMSLAVRGETRFLEIHIPCLRSDKPEGRIPTMTTVIEYERRLTDDVSERACAMLSTDMDEVLALFRRTVALDQTVVEAWFRYDELCRGEKRGLWTIGYSLVHRQPYLKYQYHPAA